MKKGKIISVTGAGSFKSEYGNKKTGLMYKFHYTIEVDGKEGTVEVNHTTTEARFKEGEEVEVTPNGKAPDGTPKAKLQKLDRDWETYTVPSFPSTSIV